ncbi:Ras guanine nucleotide exchange factor bud5 [Elasticomyces elasticus]|uniref:Ras guanine nucleotide exchange factor bud5 n=1 Tax=Exophiala sideris TaxID=1016849 RepID=A0ABR0JAC9_9EURO|nr:Ras guanine nucleotide exchange factor bud5 [Elasticomyces elasticus]KAK5026230.1 Ras guanine nucleotide exchange factor bud5 [Exophiala sideris]KAK5032483.1 Ras guanine nucleotide exchange factor bud5 [Exophiala sideris]KAK5059641.1 Ras guanine nucleotide exchange factor bud5 [Exophiala sideris]KAK5178074.1 Ras guanine nucleotide exchange factor bud5 [Eurotiomycetes sp. CCFEE 6388]
MRGNQPSSIFIAPLRVQKNGGTDNNHDDGTGYAPNNASPTTILDSEHLDELALDHARFHNYLRALYPFQPSSPHSSTTVTLPLNAGDIILVHSVHVNGWADGTVLETGARGWLPTNYCEAYDYAAMRPLLKALTEFWDIVKAGSDSSASLFRSQDYMRGLVAGVRALLERSDCLTRDSGLVKEHEAIRSSRKSLLSDLALLVRTAKQLQQIVTTVTPNKELDIRLDDMLLQAFRIVTRAVSFFDVWTTETTAALSPTVPPEALTEPLSPLPANLSNYTPSSLRNSASVETKPSASMLLSQRTSRNMPVRISPLRRQSSTTHRMSYGRILDPMNPNLISQLLHKAYDDFLTVLASFLGSHMQSRSSSELLLTTQNAVRSCRQLFAIVETVIERDYSTSRPLIQAKDAMYYAITELVHAARQVFKPIHSMEDDLIYLPEEAHNLVQAATACVSAAGRCVARTKTTLEEIGDFEVECLNQSGNGASNGSNTPEPTNHDRQSDTTLRSTLLASTRRAESHVPDGRPRISILGGNLTPPLSVNTTESPTSDLVSTPLTPRDDLAATLSRTAPLPPPSVLNRKSITGSPELNLSSGGPKRQAFAEILASTTAHSDSSADSSRRHSVPSNVSTASTRVTSFHGGVNGYFTDSLSPSLISDEFRRHADDEDGEAEILIHTFAQELVFNREGLIVGGTLNALVERLTAHDSTPEVSFISTIYLTFRLFATPEDFAKALAFRFYYVADNSRIATPVRLRVYNVLKGWMELHWRHDCDDTALPVIVGFARETLAPVLPSAGRRILELADYVSSTNRPLVPRVVSMIGKTNTSSAAYVDPGAPMPPPVISKSQLTALRAWKMGGAGVSILDFDALELARQITLKTSKLFCSIMPEELLATEWTKRSSSLAVNVRAMSTLSTDISNLVSDSVLQLEEPKKRAAILKQWIKIANKCFELHNYDTVMAIVCALDSTNIKRMRKTWEAVPQKTKSIFDELCKVVDVSKNYSVLRQRVQSHLPPCLPFIGVYLTDLTMVDSAFPATRELATDQGKISVINLDKHMSTAKIISELQRFQIPYRFTEISELQTWMQDQLIRVRSAGEKSFQLHYRRSLVLEPKGPNKSPNPDASHSGKDKDKFDFLNWTHLLQKDKPVPVSS